MDLFETIPCKLRIGEEEIELDLVPSLQVFHNVEKLTGKTMEELAAMTVSTEVIVEFIYGALPSNVTMTREELMRAMVYGLTYYSGVMQKISVAASTGPQVGKKRKAGKAPA